MSYKYLIFRWNGVEWYIQGNLAKLNSIVMYQDILKIFSVSASEYKFLN